MLSISLARVFIICNNEIFTILKKIGLLKFTPEEFLKNPINLDVNKIEELIKLRQQAKINKNFSQADQIRSEIESLGVVIEDSLGGTSWRKK